MGVQRATTLYPVNTTTVDSGSGIDIRLLDSAEAGADDSTQTAAFTQANDNVERTFDPATGGVTNTNDANTTLFKAGWALRLSQDMTAADDTNCDVMLTGGTVTVSLRVNVNQTGATYTGGTFAPTFKASLWKYNPSTDIGSLIASGTTTATTWTLGSLGDLGTAKTATINITVPTTTFSAGSTAAEVLYLQVGFNTNNVPNGVGTANFTMTLTVDNTNTKVVFGSGVNLIQYCSFTNLLSGTGTVTRGAMPLTLSARNVTSNGTVTHSRLSTIAKTFSLNGVGTPTFSKFTTANRSFSLQASGTVLKQGTNASTVAIPIDEIPEASSSNTTYIFPILD